MVSRLATCRGETPRDITTACELMLRHNGYVALNAAIVGGEHGREHLGVWLQHEPADFGIVPPEAGAPRVHESWYQLSDSAQQSWWERLQAIGENEKQGRYRYVVTTTLLGTEASA